MPKRKHTLLTCTESSRNPRGGCDQLHCTEEETEARTESRLGSPTLNLVWLTTALQKGLSPTLCKKITVRENSSHDNLELQDTLWLTTNFHGLLLGTQSTGLMCKQSSVPVVTSWEIQKMAHFDFQRAPCVRPHFTQRGDGEEVRGFRMKMHSLSIIPYCFTSTFISWDKASPSMGRAAQQGHRSLRDQETKAQGYKMKSQS